LIVGIHHGTAVPMEDYQLAPALVREKVWAPITGSSRDARYALAMTESDDVDPTASANAYVGPAPSAPAQPAEPGNPFTGALVAIYIISFLVGFILVGIGAGNAGDYDPSLYSSHTDNGVAFIVWGGAFLNLAIVASIVHIGVAAVLHR
jgi:hypothetical protein